MAAISNAEWKSGAMQKAERLTDIWDIIKAWAGRAAEIVLSLCMFAQLIGILPGVHYPDLVSNCILGVQMIMLDFGAFALAPLAEHARNAGQDDAAKKADDMSRFLIGLVIATVVIVSVGQFAPLFGAWAWLVTGIVKYSEPVLILARIVCVVKYIHVIHALRSHAALSIHPTQPSIQVPTQPLQDGRIDEIIEAMKRIESTVVENSSIQLSTQSTQIVEEPTHDLYADIKPLQLKIVGASTGLHLLTMAAIATDTSEDVIEDAAACEANTEVTQVDAVTEYPIVPGVSDRKVRELIDAFLSGTKWTEMKGNYSQTIKPVREMWENLHPSTCDM